MLTLTFLTSEYSQGQYHECQCPGSLQQQGIRSHSINHVGLLTHYALVKHTIIASDSDLSPVWRQAIIWTNTAILSTRPRGYLSQILFKIQKFAFKKMHFKMLSAKLCPFCLGLSVLTEPGPPWGGIWTTCATSVWRNDAKCENIFMFPDNTSVFKGLSCYWCQHQYE